MRIEKGRNNIFLLTLSGYELATLISSARWAGEGGKGELTNDAVNQLKKVLENYDNAVNKLQDNLQQKANS
jgi:hypothetical protein